MATIGRVLYENIWRQASAIAYSGTSTPGFEYINAIDWLDWSLFSTQLSTLTTLTANVLAGTTFDSWALYCIPFDLRDTADEAIIGISLIGGAIIGAQPTGSCVVFLQKETAVGSNAYTTIDSVTLQGTTAVFFREFSAVTINGERIRMTFSNAVGSQLYIRDFAVGNAMRFPLGQHVDIAPPSLASGFVVTNTQSVNGSVLGRQTRRVEKTATIMLDPVSAEFVRETWNPFAKHASKEAFYWSWNYNLYPEDAAFCVATDIVAPINISPPPYMKVEMPMKVLT